MDKRLKNDISVKYYLSISWSFSASEAEAISPGLRNSAKHPNITHNVYYVK